MSKYTFNIKPNPAILPIKERIKTQGRWNARALFPQAKRKREKPPTKVFIITRDERRFAVVASNKVEAENQITDL